MRISKTSLLLFSFFLKWYNTVRFWHYNISVFKLNYSTVFFYKFQTQIQSRPVSYHLLDYNYHMRLPYALYLIPISSVKWYFFWPTNINNSHRLLFFFQSSTNKFCQHKLQWSKKQLPKAEKSVRKSVQKRPNTFETVEKSHHFYSLFLALSATLNRCLQQNRPKTQHKTDDNTRQTFNMISKMNTKKVPTCTQNAKKNNK